MHITAQLRATGTWSTPLERGEIALGMARGRALGTGASQEARGAVGRGLQSSVPSPCGGKSHHTNLPAHSWHTFRVRLRCPVDPRCYQPVINEGNQ